MTVKINNLIPFKQIIKPQGQKLTKQFINYPKQLSNMSKSKPQLQKQKTFEQQTKVYKYSGPVQGDFMKIGCTYILQNDKLTKKTFLSGRQNFKQADQITEEIINGSVESEDIDIIKQKAKLQYLEKKGYLKPDETQRLQKLRGQNSLTLIVTPDKRIQKKNVNEMDGRYFEFENEQDCENMDPNYYHQGYNSPRNKPASMKYLPQQNYHPQNRHQSQFYHQQPYHQQASYKHQMQNNHSHMSYY